MLTFAAPHQVAPGPAPDAARSPVRRLAGFVFRQMEQRLPGALYRAAYDATFHTYRAIVRVAFLRFVVNYRVRRDRPNTHKALAIWRMMPRSLVGWRGLVATWDAVMQVERDAIPGALVECGVARGGSAGTMMLASRAAGGHRALWLFDSFEGLPPPGEQDFLPGTDRTGDHVRPLPPGSCLGTYDEVAELMRERLSVPAEQLHMRQGWFEDTLPVAAGEVGPIAVLRIDADWYDSVMTCLDTLFGAIEPGGYLIIDDYYTCFGAREALDTFRRRHAIDAPLFADGRGGILMRVPRAPGADARST